jgi:hypothetical protein
LSQINPVPNAPDKDRFNSALFDSGVKPATPDLFLTRDEELPIDIVTELLFEDIGSIEVLNIARSEIINGRDVSYGLIPRLSDLSKRHGPLNIFKVPGTLSEFFDNFTIKLREHIPETGTGPSKIYIGPEDSFGCTGYPVLDYRTDAVIQCFATLKEAEDFVANSDIRRDLVYSEQDTGNIIIDVINLKKDYRVDIELLVEGTLENDTIY